jgi:sphinganine-1-phosphate aldolase
VFSRAKKRIFKLARYIPAIQAKIDGEISKITKDFEDEMSKHGDKLGYITSLPEKGLSKEQIIGQVDNYLNLGKCVFRKNA